MKKIIFFIILYSLVNSLFALPTFANTDINAGFVKGIWFSRVPFFTNETIKIYTAFQNQSEFNISGQVEFKDNDIIIGSTEFSAESGDLIDASIDWTVTKGNHIISAKLVNITNEDSEVVNLESDSTSAEDLFADDDTDGDRIGNIEDTDDDNDGILDQDDPEPLKADSKMISKESVSKIINVAQNTHNTIGEVLGSFSEKKDEKINNILEEERKREKEEKEEKEGEEGEEEVKTSNATTTAEILTAKNQIESKEKEPYWEKLKLIILKSLSYILKHQWLFYITSILTVFFIIWIGVKIFRRH